MNRAFYVYLLATRRDGPLYVGITNDLMRRVSEHKNKTFKGFTARYNVDRLVYFETIEQPDAAILREKQLKR
jgi:putative endonuclease